MFKKRCKELLEVMEKCICEYEKEEIEADFALQCFQKLLKNTKGIVYVVGNGASAGVASHFCLELLKTVGIASSSLADMSVMTAIANDLGYEYIYSKQLERLLKKEDLLIAISGSGKSKNLINGAAIAKERGVKTVTLTGCFKDNPLRMQADLSFWLNSSDYGLIETAHLFLLHSVIDINHFSCS